MGIGTATRRRFSAVRSSAKSGLALLFSAVLGASSAAGADLEIYFVDVLGGAATLIVTPERETILVDSGWPGHEDRDPLRIIQALKDAGRDRIDHLITTHWHMDHFGGVEGLARRIPIGKFWDRGLPEDGIPGADYPDGPTAADPLGIAYRAASEGKRGILKAGDVLPLRGSVSAVVLAASGVVAPPSSAAISNPLCEDAPPDMPIDRSDNARSIVLKFRMGEFDFLDCGDLTWNVEKQLVCPLNLVGKVDLFQVTHHGLDVSNHPTFLRSIAPTVAVMDNGPTKGGTAAAVRRLRQVASIRAAYQLHKNAKTGDEDNAPAEFIANSDPAGGRYIRVAVPEDGKTFRVRFGADGEDRTFEAR